MGWLFCTLILICYFSVRADEAPTWAELNELNGKLEKVESGLSTDNRLKRIEKSVNLLLESQEVLKGDIMSRLEEIEGRLDRCQPTNPSTTRSTTAEPPTTTTTTGVETTSTPSPKNCQDVYTNGGQVSGVYSIFPNGTEEVQVFCEQELQEGGWTVFQRRINGTIDFYRGWDAYQQGFGSAGGEYWIGNDHLHQLTVQNNTQLLVELKYGGETQYATYTEFWVLSEHLKYELHIAGYTGGYYPGDSLQKAYGHNHTGQPFSTRDRDNDKWMNNCAELYYGGWWYNSCYGANMNGRYNGTRYTGIYWLTWKGYTNLSGTRMMLKTK